MNACTINYFLKINYHAYVAMLIVFKLSLLCSGILAGIFPDACTEETLKFMKMNFHADILVADHKTLQTLLVVIITTVSVIAWYASIYMCEKHKKCTKFCGIDSAQSSISSIHILA